MPADPLALAATPQRVRAAARAAKLSDLALDRALRFASATPAAEAWARFLSRTLAALGAGLVLAGVVCFVAYNWARVGRFGKFALIEAAIVAAALLGWRNLPRLSGQLGLFAASVLVGPLLAVYGQTYQTGADPYGLFLTWAGLIVPWVIVTRFSALWVLALALVDVSLVLFWSQVLGWNELNEAVVLPLTIAALHAIAITGWERQFIRATPWLDETWAVHAVAALGYTALLIAAATSAVVDTEAGVAGLLAVIAFAAAIAVAFHFYRQTRRDRFMVAIAVAAGMAWIAVVVGRVLFSELDLEEAGFFLMAIFVLAEITLGLHWFRSSRPPGSAAKP